MVSECELDGDNGIEYVRLFCKLRDGARFPTRGSDGSGGYDLYACEDFTLPSVGCRHTVPATAEEKAKWAERIPDAESREFNVSKPVLTGPLMIKTGIGIIIPHGHCGQFWCRSSLGKAGMIVHGGFIDSDYRGELCVLASSLYKPIPFKAGERICQMAIVPCFMPGNIEYDRKGGLGSTGK